MAKDNVVNFNKARKAKARHQKVLKAASNRVKFGTKKSQKEKNAALAKKLQRHLDGHKRDGHTEPSPSPNTPPSDAPSYDPSSDPSKT